MNETKFFPLIIAIQSMIILVWLILGVYLPLVVVFASVFLGNTIILYLITKKKQIKKLQYLENNLRENSSKLMASKYCSNCGTKSTPKDNYCISCGFRLL